MSVATTRTCRPKCSSIRLILVLDLTFFYHAKQFAHSDRLPNTVINKVHLLVPGNFFPSHRVTALRRLHLGLTKQHRRATVWGPVPYAPTNQNSTTRQNKKLWTFMIPLFKSKCWIMGVKWPQRLEIRCTNPLLYISKFDSSESRKSL